jgi:hypothetical protein
MVEKTEITAVGIRHADHVASCPQTLALTSLTSGGRSVGIVRWWTQATEFSFFSMESVNWVTTNFKVLH